MGNNQSENDEEREKKLPKPLVEKDWTKELTQEEFYVMRNQGTERPFSEGNFNDNKKEGIYKCKGCNVVLFSSEGKFNSGTG
jgi:peptide-methionine (R)-S-oxide reductase